MRRPPGIPWWSASDPTTVIVEVCWLVEERPDVEAAFLESVVAGEFKHVAITAADLARTAELVRTYADLPLGAVDASVIAVAERLNLTEVATVHVRRSMAGCFECPSPVAGLFRTFVHQMSSGAGGARTHDRRIMSPP